MHTLSLRTVRAAALLVVALSTFAVAHAKTPAKTTVVQVRHVKPISTETLKAAKRTPTMPAAARSTAPPVERGTVVDLDGSRFQYDSCGCGT
jgi:hypothetical protein